MLKKDFEFDIKKIKKSDREILLSYYSSSAMFNSNMNLSNVSLVMSFLSLTVATLAFVVSVTNNLLIILPLAIFGVVFVFITHNAYKKSSKRVNLIINNLVKQHNELFEHHFDYAKKK